MNIGDTFLWQPPHSTRPHLYIILSHPSENDGVFVILNITESRGSKWSAALRRGQHPYIYKDSDVNFVDAQATTEAKIDQQKRLGSLFENAPMDLRIVQQIINVARKHPCFNGVLRRYLPRRDVASLGDLDRAYTVDPPPGLAEG